MCNSSRRCGQCGANLIDQNTVITAAHCILENYEYALFFGLHNNSLDKLTDPAPGVMRRVCRFIIVSFFL